VASAARAGLTVAPASKRADRAGRVALGLRCLGGAACRGAIDVFIAGTKTRVATARFVLAPGGERVVRPTLSPRARRLLRAKRRLALVVKTRGARVGSQPILVTANMSVTRR
jgi:hypothetical protein